MLKTMFVLGLFVGLLLIGCRDNTSKGDKVSIANPEMLQELKENKLYTGD